MIKLILDLFGGRGSSSGSTGSSMQQATTSTKEKATTGEKVSRVRPDEEYTVYSLKFNKETSIGDRSGRSIMEDIRNETLTYNNRRDAWVNTQGDKFIIRRKKR